MSIPFERSFASHEKAQFWSSKNAVKPENVRRCSGRKYLFNCNKCDHEFETRISFVQNDGWCPYCVVPSRKLCEKEDCLNCYNRSFASHEKSKFWSLENNLNPRDILKNTPNKYKFNCCCGHEFESALYNIVIGRWCSYCAVPSRKLCEKENCENCHNRSFASHEKAKYWSSKNELIPRKVLKNSHTKYLFNCSCGHEIKISLLGVNSGEWCCYCCNPPLKLCDKEDCLNCINKSFISHEKAQFWSSKNDLNPRQFFKNSTKMCWFKCAKNHDFDIKLNAISSGNWCRYCINKTEQKLFEMFVSIYPSLQQQFRADWCKRKFYDFCIPEHKIIIELDGLQHFEQVSNWTSPEETNKNDKYKMECASENGYSIIRLLQPDVLKNTYNWMKELQNAVEKIIIEGSVQQVYLHKNGEYDNF